MLKILIAVDGSEPARRALEEVAKLAHSERSQAEVKAVLLHVRESESLPGTLPTAAGQQMLEEQARQRQDNLLLNAQDHARLLGLSQVAVRRAQGDAAQEILRAAEHEKVDQIAMGTRGMSALGNLLLGSVAQKVLHLGHTPVLLVK
jgi:nucleotide-binding universal stress UspA family protein